LLTRSTAVVDGLLLLEIHGEGVAGGSFILVLALSCSKKARNRESSETEHREEGPFIARLAAWWLERSGYKVGCRASSGEADKREWEPRSRSLSGKVARAQSGSTARHEPRYRRHYFANLYRSSSLVY